MIDDNPANDLLDVKCSLDNDVDSVKAEVLMELSSGISIPFTECSPVSLWRMPAWGMSSRCWKSFMTSLLWSSRRREVRARGVLNEMAMFLNILVSLFHPSKADPVCFILLCNSPVVKTRLLQ